MKPTSDNTFCWYPFVQLALKEWNHKKGIVSAAPCCNSIRPETPDPLNVNYKLREGDETITAKQIFEGKEMSEIRQAMLDGVRHPACNTCWKVEDRNPGQRTSYRHFSSPPDPDDVDVNDPKLQCIDFAFGENCNLRCRMCQPGLSNKLRHDYKYFYENNIDTSGMQAFDWQRRHRELGIDKPLEQDLDLRPNSHNEILNFKNGEQWNNILDNIHDIRQIKATGGETVMTQPFNEFIDRAIETGACDKILLEFHSNSTKFTPSLVEKLNKFKRIHLNASIDSIEKNYEYIRYPMPWDKLTESLERLLSKITIPMHVSFNPVLSALNAHYVTELYDYQITLKDKYPEFRYNLFLDLLWPEEKYINVKFLSKDIKLNLIEMYEEYFEKYDNFSVLQCIDFFKHNLDYPVTDTDRKNMLREIKAFDKSRNQDYHDYLHKDIIKYLETPIE